MVLGSFAVITVVGGRGDRDHDLDAYRGLGRRQPALALAFTSAPSGQTGVPFTTGFLAKLYVISAAVKAHSYALAVIAMLSAAVAAAFYLRLVFLMYGVRLPVGTGDDRGSLSLPIAGEASDDLEAPRAGPRKVGLGPVPVPVPTRGGDLRHRRGHGRVRDLARTARRFREGGRASFLSPSSLGRLVKPSGGQPGPQRAGGAPGDLAQPGSAPSSEPGGWKNLPIRGSSQNDSARAMASAIGKRVLGPVPHDIARQPLRPELRVEAPERLDLHRVGHPSQQPALDPAPLLAGEHGPHGGEVEPEVLVTRLA